jgi:iron complex outermembrane receptor protein
LTGLEGEVSWLATDRLRVDFSLSAMDHEYDEFFFSGADLSDNDIPFSPDLKWGLTLTYEHAVMNGNLVWSTSFNHIDETEMSVFNTPRTQMQERDIWDANVTYHPGDGRYRVTLWGKNLTDEVLRFGSNSVAGLWNMTNYDRPRSIGIEFSMRFN